MARRSHRQLAFFSVAKQAMRSSSGRPERGLNGLSPIACDVSSLGLACPTGNVVSWVKASFKSKI